MSGKRWLKIHEGGDAYAIRQRGHECSVPVIRLQGKWLREAGFVAGGKVTVLVREGQLTLLVAEDEQDGRAFRGSTGEATDDGQGRD